MDKRLYRSRNDRMVWGVCGGVAQYFDIDPTIVRIITVLLIFANGLGILAYIILAMLVPLESTETTAPKDTIKDNIEEMKGTAEQLGRQFYTTFSREKDKANRQRRHLIVGAIVIALGLLLLLGNMNLLWWLRWSYLWPLVLVAVGLLIILSVRKR